MRYLWEPKTWNKPLSADEIAYLVSDGNESRSGLISRITSKIAYAFELIAGWLIGKRNGWTPDTRVELKE